MLLLQRGSVHWTSFDWSSLKNNSWNLLWLSLFCTLTQLQIDTAPQRGKFPTEAHLGYSFNRSQLKLAQVIQNMSGQQTQRNCATFTHWACLINIYFFLQPMSSCPFLYNLGTKGYFKIKWYCIILWSWKVHLIKTSFHQSLNLDRCIFFPHM